MESIVGRTVAAFFTLMMAMGAYLSIKAASAQPLAYEYVHAQAIRDSMAVLFTLATLVMLVMLPVVYRRTP